MVRTQGRNREKRIDCCEPQEEHRHGEEGQLQDEERQEDQLHGEGERTQNASSFRLQLLRVEARKKVSTSWQESNAGVQTRGEGLEEALITLMLSN